MGTPQQLVYRSMSEEGVWVQHIPGDGNCLYGSLVHQLWRIQPTDPKFPGAVFKMRTMLVEFIRNNLPRYWDHLLPFAEDFIKTDCLDDYHRIREYLTLLASDGTWGGEESLSAACELFTVNIDVWQENTGRPITYFSSTTSNKTVSLLYTGAHYDSVLWTARVALGDVADTRLVSCRGETLQVVTFSGYPTSLYQAFLHQLHITPDEDALSILQYFLKNLNESTANHGTALPIFA